MTTPSLSTFAGSWTGTYRLWLEPGVLRCEGPTALVGRTVLDGRFVALDYDWTDVDGPQSGSMLVGCTSEGVWQVSWIDTWHMGTGILFCEGRPGAGPDVLGSYGPAEEPWGWRTRLDLAPAGDGLTITAWNVTPAGEEAKATEATYTRAN